MFLWERAQAVVGTFPACGQVLAQVTPGTTEQSWPLLSSCACSCADVGADPASAMLSSAPL